MEKLNFLADVAEAVLVEGLTQQQAAERFNMSRPSISRLLAEAREAGLVKVEILRPQSDRPDLATELCRIYGLSGSFVVGSSSTTSLLSSNAALARYAAGKVGAMLDDSIMLGVTMGKTIGSLIHELSKGDRKQISVVQLCGSVGAGEPLLDSHALVAHLAQAYGVSSLHFHAPYAVETREMRDMLNSHASNQLCLTQARKVDIALVGIGGITPAHSSLHLGGHIDAQTMRRLENSGAVGDVAGYYVRAEGTLLDTTASSFWRTGISAEEFRQIPRRIGVAAGPQKIDAIIATMRERWVTDLITDEKTARELINNQ